MKDEEQEQYEREKGERGGGGGDNQNKKKHPQTLTKIRCFSINFHSKGQIDTRIRKKMDIFLIIHTKVFMLFYDAP